MVDNAVLAKKLAAIRDAVARIRELARRLRAASGLRNLIAHQYGAIDVDRIFELASTDTEDLLSFCRQLAQYVERR